MNTNKKLDVHDCIVIAIILLFFNLGVYYALYQDVNVDEAITYNIVMRLPYHFILSGIDSHPPLYYLIVKLLPHSSVAIIRFYSLLMVVLAISIGYLSIRKYKGISVAYGFVIISCLSTSLSYHSVSARMYGLVFLLSVLVLHFFLAKRYSLVILLISVSSLVHYYSLFLFIPFFASLFFSERKQFWSYVKTFFGIFVWFAVIIALLLHHQLFSGNNPYMLPPPNDLNNIKSFPSSVVYPLFDPSELKSIGIVSLALLLVCMVLYLIFSYKEAELRIKYFCLFSFFTVIFLVALSFLHVPYHHRYLTVFYPFLFLMYSSSLFHGSKPKFVVLFFVLFLIIISVVHFTSIETQFQEVASVINCTVPKNILHETPFSLLPLTIYMPNCRHYIATEGIWRITNETIYSPSDRIDNANVSYDYYVYYFSDMRAGYLLNNSPNVSMIFIS